jgi:hypothetical protein
MNMNIEKAIDTILHEEWSAQDLTRMASAINMKRDHIAKKLARQLSTGDKVTWTGKHGFMQTGTVQRIAIKNVVVKADGDMGVVWRIPASMLSISTEWRI